MHDRKVRERFLDQNRKSRNVINRDKAALGNVAKDVEESFQFSRSMIATSGGRERGNVSRYIQSDRAPRVPFLNSSRSTHHVDVNWRTRKDIQKLSARNMQQSILEDPGTDFVKPTDDDDSRAGIDTQAARKPIRSAEKSETQPETCVKRRRLRKIVESSDDETVEEAANDLSNPANSETLNTMIDKVNGNMSENIANSELRRLVSYKLQETNGGLEADQLEAIFSNIPGDDSGEAEPKNETDSKVIEGDKSDDDIEDESKRETGAPLKRTWITLSENRRKAATKFEMDPVDVQEIMNDLENILRERRAPCIMSPTIVISGFRTRRPLQT